MPVPDHYEVLDVLPSSSPDEIKRRYRELVRENHPDISSDREAAHEKMQVILSAYGVLSNPDARARYDRDRSKHNEAAQDDARLARRREPGTNTGAGMAAPEVVRRARAAQNARSRDGDNRGRNPRTRLLTMVFEAAQMFFFENRAGEAITLCQRVLQADPRNPEAAALLGDIYLSQERRDLALLMFERAMRAQPTNLLYKQKWNALRRNEPVPASNFARPAETTSNEVAPDMITPDVAASDAATSPDTSPQTTSETPETEAAPTEAPKVEASPAPNLEAQPLRAKLGFSPDVVAPEKAKGRPLFEKLFGKR